MTLKKTLRREGDRESEGNDHSKCKAYQFDATMPAEHCAAAVSATCAEKPATENHSSKQYYHPMSNCYSERLPCIRETHNNSNEEHNGGEREHRFPRNSVVKNTSGELHETSVDAEADR